MKLSRSAVFLLCLLASAVMTALNQNPQVDWVRGTDFSRIHSFTWATAVYPIQDPDVNLGLARAVQDELEAKSVQYVSSDQKFDVFVTYNAKVNQDPANLSQNLLTLNVRIFDAKNNSVIWSAGGHIALGKDKAQNRSKAHELLVQMFQKYPPQ
jgi:hypothetical protein